MSDSFQVNYTTNGGPVMVMNILRADYTNGFFLVDLRLPVSPNSDYRIAIAGYNVRGIGAIFNVQDIVTPLSRKSAHK